MKCEDVFGFSVVRINCEDETVYKNEELTKSVNFVFNSTRVTYRDRTQKGDSHKGGGLTTASESYLSIVELPGAQPLKKWVSEQFLKAKDTMGCSDKGNSIYFKRSWANRLYRGGHGLVHNHAKIDNFISEMTDYARKDFNPDAVGILYVDVPESSSNLVFVNNGRSQTWIDEYDELDTHWITPVQGQIVIHSPLLCHAVSIHHSNLPRNVFVFDIDYVDEE